VLRKCIPHRVKVWRDCPHIISSFPLSQIPIRGCLAFVIFSGVVSCQMRRVWNYFSYHGLCPPVEQLGASVRHFHRPLAFCDMLSPFFCLSPSTQFFFEFTKKKLKIFFLTGWTVCHGHASVGAARGTRTRWN
jgi:hypothetical protein